jgi:hypothetical protein
MFFYRLILLCSADFFRFCQTNTLILVYDLPVPSCQMYRSSRQTQTSEHSEFRQRHIVPWKRPFFNATSFRVPRNILLDHVACVVQLTVIRQRPARRRGIADSESDASVSPASSTDSSLIEEPPRKKKTLMVVCFLLCLQ